MNLALILAAGVGQRMRNSGLPKQFLKLFGKPIIIYTLERFEQSPEIDAIVIVCREGYLDLMRGLLADYSMRKVSHLVIGGNSRQASLRKGLEAIREKGGKDEDIVVIHDGVRPMVSLSTIRENVRMAREHGCAVTVRPATESVVVTDSGVAGIADFKNRRSTYFLTSPQTFLLGTIWKAYEAADAEDYGGMPLLDAGMLYASRGEDVHLVKERNKNVKITTPEDFYYLKAMIELEENMSIFGI